MSCLQPPKASTIGTLEGYDGEYVVKECRKETFEAHTQCDHMVGDQLTAETNDRSHVSSQALITRGFTKIVVRCCCIYFRVYLLMIAMECSDIMKFNDSFQTCSFRASRSSSEHIGRCSSYLTVARETKVLFHQVLDNKQEIVQRRGLSGRDAGSRDTCHLRAILSPVWRSRPPVSRA